MEELLTGLVSSIIGGADSVINTVFNSLLDVCFNAEQGLTNILGTEILNFTTLKEVILSFAITLIILKFLKKGFEIYIMWTEGDTDIPSSTYITYFIRALVLAISFPVLYDWFIRTARSFADSILLALNIGEQQGIIEALLKGVPLGLFSSIFAVIILVMLFLLYIQLLMRGIEMFILKIGFPLACVGLVDSDKGVFAPYVKKFFQSTLTVIVQLALVKIGILLIISNQFIYATAVLLLALRTPKFLQEFMLTTGNGGSGISNAVHTTSKTIELTKQVSNVIGKVK